MQTFPHTIKKNYIEVNVLNDIKKIRHFEINLKDKNKCKN